eukprot:Filipodium_phascolosomae@DN1317_c0_g1_i1.p1
MAQAEWKAILKDIKKDDCDGLKSKLETNQHLNINELHKGYGLIHLATQRGDEEVVEVVLEQKKLTVNLKDENGFNALHTLIAMSTGSSRLIRKLVEMGIGLNDHDLSGRTPLHWAAAQNWADTVELLFELGAVVDAKEVTNQQATPLLTAIKDGSEEAALKLLECGANVNARDAETGDTALHLCARYRAANVASEILTKIKDSLDPATYTNHAGETPLHVACQEEESGETIRVLLGKHGFSMDQADNKGVTPTDVEKEVQDRIEEGTKELDEYRQRKKQSKKMDKDVKMEATDVTAFLTTYGFDDEAVKSAFFKYGYTSVDEEFLAITDSDLRNIGIKDESTRGDLLKAIEKVRKEEERQMDLLEARYALAEKIAGSIKGCFALVILVIVFVIVYYYLQWQIHIRSTTPGASSGDKPAPGPGGPGGRYW